MQIKRRTVNNKIYLLRQQVWYQLFVKLWALKTEEHVAQSCPMGLSGETVSSDLHKSDSVKSRLWWLKNEVCLVW